MLIKNISPGARGVNTRNGPVLIEAGAEIEAELSAAEHKVSHATGWFEFDGAPPAEHSDTEDFDALSDDDLRAFIEKRDGKAPHPNAKRETLLAKARGSDAE